MLYLPAYLILDGDHFETSEPWMDEHAGRRYLGKPVLPQLGALPLLQWFAGWKDHSVQWLLLLLVGPLARLILELQPTIKMKLIWLSRPANSTRDAVLACICGRPMAASPQVQHVRH